MPARARELAAVVGLVAVADFALWRQDGLSVGGVGLATFFVLVPLLVLAAARGRRLTLRLAAIGVMLGAVTARSAYAPTVGTTLLGLLGVFALAVAMRQRSSFLTNVAASFGATAVTFPFRIAAAFRGAHRIAAGRSRRRFTGAILIPIALVGVFVTIFAFANPLVARWVGFVGSAVVLPDPMRLALWGSLAFGAVLLLRPAIHRSFAVEHADSDDATEASLAIGRNALVALNVLFLLYNALDATYLWAGAPPPGVTEQAYAHQGAAWLTVALLVLTAVVGVLFHGALAHDPRARLARILAYAWLGQGAVLALGTFRRIAIHVSTSGLSNVRILGIAGTALVAFGLVLIGTKLHRRFTFAWLLRRQLDALVVGLLAFSILPTHLVSARVNVSRILMHRYQPLVNVTEEAAEVESTAALLPLVEHDDERIRRGVAALLLNELDTLRRREQHAGLRDTDLATRKARADLERAEPQLEAVLGDVERSDAIRQWEYIRNSAIEGVISQSEIDKVEMAPAGDQKVFRRWIAAHRARDVESLANDYADRVLFDGVRLTRAEVMEKKRTAAELGLSHDVVEHAPSPVAVDGSSPLRAEGHVAVSASARGVTLVFEQRPEGWKIVEERSLY
ncbi:MAG: DUF4173 domain-containing protein [Labilithrix sp.]|nr:DUF4173 domain-containing protein [Labilithrix sp.]MCW5817927.1 DUF4173 domain-containing protein [Labilithrix sp.]